LDPASDIKNGPFTSREEGWKPSLLPPPRRTGKGIGVRCGIHWLIGPSEFSLRVSERAVSADITNIINPALVTTIDRYSRNTMPLAAETPVEDSCSFPAPGMLRYSIVFTPIESVAVVDMPCKMVSMWVQETQQDPRFNTDTTEYILNHLPHVIYPDPDGEEHPGILIDTVNPPPSYLTRLIQYPRPEELWDVVAALFSSPKSYFVIHPEVHLSRTPSYTDRFYLISEIKASIVHLDFIHDTARLCIHPDTKAVLAMDFEVLFRAYPVCFVPDDMRSEWIEEFRRDMDAAQWEVSCKVLKCMMNTQYGQGNVVTWWRIGPMFGPEDRYTEEIPWGLAEMINSVHEMLKSLFIIKATQWEELCEYMSTVDPKQPAGRYWREYTEGLVIAHRWELKEKFDRVREQIFRKRELASKAGNLKDSTSPKKRLSKPMKRTALVPQRKNLKLMPERPVPRKVKPAAGASSAQPTDRKRRKTESASTLFRQAHRPSDVNIGYDTITGGKTASRFTPLSETAHGPTVGATKQPVRPYPTPTPPHDRHVQITETPTGGKTVSRTLQPSETVRIRYNMDSGAYVGIVREDPQSYNMFSQPPAVQNSYPTPPADFHAPNNHQPVRTLQEQDANSPSQFTMLPPPLLTRPGSSSHAEVGSRV
jgi:hypothetical protein